MLDGQSASTAATMIERFEQLRPLLAEQSGRFDADRRLSDEVFGALSEAGFFRLLLPVQLGGCGLSPLDFMTVVEHAAALDGTIGWLVGNGGGISRAGGYLPLKAAQKVFGKPSAFVASSTGAIGKAVPAKSGYRITGRWPFASGAPHATTFAALCEVDEGKGSANGRIVLAFLPREAVNLIDNWHVSGMRGTGSWDFDADNAFLPAEFVCDFQPVLPSRASSIVFRAVPPLSGRSPLCRWGSRRAQSTRSSRSAPATVDRASPSHRGTRTGSRRDRALPCEVQGGWRLHAVSHVGLVRVRRKRGL